MTRTVRLTFADRYREAILDREKGRTLTVHHLDGNKHNLEDWNLAALCLLPESPIMLGDGRKVPIEDVQEGDLVIGSDLEPHRVTQTFERWYEGEVIRLRAGKETRVWMTPDHEVLTAAENWRPIGQLETGESVTTVHLGTHNSHPAWNEGLTKEDDPRVQKYADSLSETILNDEEELERRRKRMEEDNPMYDEETRERVLEQLHESLKGKTVDYSATEIAFKRISAEKEQFEERGYRYIPVGHAPAIPDAIAIKDGEVYAVEVEYGKPDYDKYEDYDHEFDDIIWVVRDAEPDGGLSLHNRTAKIQTLRRKHYEGYVYNLEVGDVHSYVAGSTVVHNCQRCHLQIQNKVDWYTDTLTGVHTEWLAEHVRAYNEWAEEHDRPTLKLTKTRPNRRPYWPDEEGEP